MDYLSHYVLLQASFLNCLCPFFQHVHITLVYPFVCISYVYQTPALSQLVRRLYILQYHITHPPYRMSILSSFVKSFSFTVQVSILTENNTPALVIRNRPRHTLHFHCTSYTPNVHRKHRIYSCYQPISYIRAWPITNHLCLLHI